MGPNVHIQCSTSTKQHLRPQHLKQHPETQHAQSRHSPGGAAVIRSTSHAKFCATCAHRCSANRSAHLHETHSAVRMPTGAAEPAVQSDCMLPSQSPANRCMPPELARCCTTPDQSLSSAQSQGSRSGRHSGARSSTVTVTASLVASPTRCLAPASPFPVDISDWRLVQM